MGIEELGHVRIAVAKSYGEIVPTPNAISERYIDLLIVGKPPEIVDVLARDFNGKRRSLRISGTRQKPGHALKGGTVTATDGNQVDHHIRSNACLCSGRTGFQRKGSIAKRQKVIDELQVCAVPTVPSGKSADRTSRAPV
ncbi:MAG: hypothetical protein AAGA73_01655 [Pseudomonadota bacterium]